MKKLGKVVAVAAACAALTGSVAAFSACGGSELEINITGSTSMEEVMGKLADAFIADYEEANGVTPTINITGSGSGAGIEDAMEGRVDFGMSSRKLEGDELDSLEYTNICLDGIALVVNKNCAVTNVTTAEVKALYEDGTTIQNTIKYALSREEGSGTRSGFEDVVGIKKLCQNEGFTQHGSTGEVAKLIADNKACDTIGYISLGSVDTTVKAVQYNGVDANETNILNGTYGLQRPFVVCYQSEAELSDIAKEFIDFIMSAEGQAILEKEGYISETH